MTKHPKHDAADRIGELHDAQDRQLADNLGIGKIDPKAALTGKIPLRVTTEVVSPYERKEKIVENK